MFIYTQKDLDILKIKFKDSDRIINNYSQVLQDIFVLSALNGKREGYFLEIGCNDPYVNSNTYLLESIFGWSGISIDITFSESFKKNRRSDYLVQDALSLDYNKLLQDKKFPKVIDYLSLDIDPGYNSLSCLEILPLDNYIFRVITFEHDCYSFPGEVGDQIRKKQREILKNAGYLMVAGNISNTGNDGNLNSFEDWWIHPEFIDKDLIEKLSVQTEDNKKPTSVVYV